MNRRDLRRASRALRALAWIILAIGGLAALLPMATAVAGQGFGDPSAPIAAFLLAVIVLLATLIAFAVLYGVAEGIRKLLDVDAKLAELEHRRGDGAQR